MSMRSQNYHVRGPEAERVYTVQSLGPERYRVTSPEGQQWEVDAFVPAPGHLHMLVEGQSVDADVRLAAEQYQVQLGGELHALEVLNERQLRMRAASGMNGKDAGPLLASPMAGKVVALAVKPGEGVVAGQTVVIVEAMKMENDIKAHRDGVVAVVHVAPGQAVEVGAPLATIE